MTVRVRVVGLTLLCVIGLALGVLLAEVLLRFQPPRAGRACAVSDPVLHHRLRPNCDKTISGVRFTTNSLGLRDREYAIPKPSGTFRILMLGDSFTEGGDSRTRPPSPSGSRRACGAAPVATGPRS